MIVKIDMRSVFPLILIEDYSSSKPGSMRLRRYSFNSTFSL